MNILMDANNTCKFVKKYNIKLLLIDNYSINLRWEKIVSHYCKIILISDLLRRKTICDYLINYHKFKLSKRENSLILKKNCKKVFRAKIFFNKKNLNIKKILKKKKI